MIADKYYFIFHNKPRRTKKKKIENLLLVLPCQMHW